MTLPVTFRFVMKTWGWKWVVCIFNCKQKQWYHVSWRRPGGCGPWEFPLRAWKSGSITLLRPESRTLPWGQGWAETRPGHLPVGGPGLVGLMAGLSRTVGSWRPTSNGLAGVGTDSHQMWSWTMIRDSKTHGCLSVLTAWMIPLWVRVFPEIARNLWTLLKGSVIIYPHYSFVSQSKCDGACNLLNFCLKLKQEKLYRK